MTVKEKREVLNKYCIGHKCAVDCKLECYNTWVHENDAGFDGEVPCLDIYDADEKELDKALELIGYKPLVCEGSQAPVEPVPVEHDPVNHPSHYCREGGMESIDEMILIFGKEAVKWFCLLNAWKYRYRASSKNGEEDLRKSDWYIRKYKELSEE